MELNEGLKKIFLAGVGAVAATAETTKEVVDNLVKKGELTVEQGKVLNEELKRNAKEKVKEHVSVTVVREYKDAMDAVDHMQPDELEALKAKIAEAEKAAAEKAACEADNDAATAENETSNIEKDVPDTSDEADGESSSCSLEEDKPAAAEHEDAQ